MKRSLPIPVLLRAAVRLAPVSVLPRYNKVTARTSGQHFPAQALQELKLAGLRQAPSLSVPWRSQGWGETSCEPNRFPPHGLLNVKCSRIPHNFQTLRPCPDSHRGGAALRLGFRRTMHLLGKQRLCIARRSREASIFGMRDDVAPAGHQGELVVSWHEVLEEGMVYS